MARVLATIFIGLLGLAFGSFLNVCLSRWPEGESIVRPRSHCRSCGRELSWWENVPLLSWIVLRGRCRECKSSIPIRYPVVEAAVGALWAAFAWRATSSVFSLETAAAMMLFSWLLIALAVLDAENMWLPDFLTVPGIVFGVIWWFVQDLQIVYEAGVPMNARVEGFKIAGHLVGVGAAAGAILLIRWIYWLVQRQEGIGLGDAKLMAMLAAWLGFPGALLSFLFGVVIGALLAMVLLVANSYRAEEASWAKMKLPLGTFLCIGGVVSALWGEQIVGTYLRLAGF